MKSYFQFHFHSISKIKKYLVFYKPFGVLSQFTGEGATLGDFDFPSGVYAAGRLDKDSEGLLILSDDGPFISRLTDPKNKKEKTYWVQVDGAPEDDDLKKMRDGVTIKGKRTRPAIAKVIELEMEERDPPVRFRKNIPTTWLEIIIYEGMNRQVRRMCAAIGFPCLRLIRVQVGKYLLNDLAPGEWKEVEKSEIIDL